MSVDKAYTLAQCSLDGTTIDGMQELGVEHGLGLQVAGADGDPFATYSAIAAVGSIITAGTSKVAVALAKFAGSEIKLYTGHTAAFYFQALALGARRTAGSTHLKKTISTGIAIPRSLSVAQGGVAQFSFDAVAIYDGTNNPILIADSQALPGTPTLDAQHTVGKVSVNGSQVSGIQSINKEFGITLFILSADGDPRPTFVAVKTIRPAIRVVTTDMSFAATLGNLGLKRSSTTVVYLQKRDQGATLVAANVAEHISFTMNEGQITPGRSGVSQEGHATKEFVLQPTYNGTNAPFVTDTACVIA